MCYIYVYNVLECIKETSFIESVTKSTSSCDFVLFFKVIFNCISLYMSTFLKLLAGEAKHIDQAYKYRISPIKRLEAISRLVLLTAWSHHQFCIINAQPNKRRGDFCVILIYCIILYNITI